MSKQIKRNKVLPFVTLFVFIYWRGCSVILTHDLPRLKRRYLRVSSAKTVTSYPKQLPEPEINNNCQRKGM